MPRRKGRKKYRKKRRNNREDSSVVFVRGPRFMPDRLFNKMVYSKEINTGSVLSHHEIFRGNGPYDPEYATGGGQPAGYDQMALLYRRYLVHASKVKLKLVNMSSTTGAAHVCLYPSTDKDSITGGLTTTVQYPYAKSIILAPNGSGSSIGELTNYITTKKIRGEKVIDTDYGGTVTNWPTREWFWHLYVQGIGGNNVNIDGIIEIEYMIEWTKREVPEDDV